MGKVAFERKVIAAQRKGFIALVRRCGGRLGINGSSESGESYLFLEKGIAFRTFNS